MKNLFKNKAKPLYVYKKPFRSNQKIFDKGTYNQIAEFLANYVFNLNRENASSEIEINMWKGRSIILMSKTIKALVWLRDNEGFKITGLSIYQSMELENIIELSKHKNMPVENINDYLTSLPGYDSKNIKQPKVTYEQHDYLQHQFESIVDIKY